MSDTPTEPRGPLPVGTPPRFGRYETWRVLGSGAFGRVYLAHDALMERYVAIKAPKDPLPADKHRAFLREARAVAEVHHPNICPVFDVGVEGALPFLVMRYVRGGTLAHLIAREPPTPAQALQFVRQIAEALEAVHEHGIFHRDLKPANILYDAKAQRLLLTDFGIARWADATNTLGGVGGGTPFYMAPEQWEPGKTFGPISARTDVYALGVMLFEFLTGERLFEGTAFQLLGQHCAAAPRRPSEVRAGLDSRFDALCLKALAKKQEERYESATAFAGAVAECLRPPAPRSRERRPGEEVEFPLPGGLKMVFCWIPPGECQLGSPKAERESVLRHTGVAEEPDWLKAEAEEVRGRFRTQGFWLGKYPVTQEEWQAVMGHNPSWFCADGLGAESIRGLDISRLPVERMSWSERHERLSREHRVDSSRFPVECVSWDDICEQNGFLDKLNGVSGVNRVFGAPAHFALPHEDMWEYASRGGLGGGRTFYWDNELNGTQANCDGCCPFGTLTQGPFLACTTPVGSYAERYPHPWGLCDIHGNVLEWCGNGYSASNMNVLRGGCWYFKPLRCRTACRHQLSRNYRSHLIGFRVCLHPD